MYKCLSLLTSVLLSAQLCSAENLRIIDWKYRVSMIYEKPIYDLLDLDIFEKQSLWGLSRGITAEKPGDYFSDIYFTGNTIDSLLADSIFTAYRDYINITIPIQLFDSIQLYIDSSTAGGRNEFFLRCADEKAVYALSGWWPKFIKYYVAFPKDTILSEKDLMADLSKIIIFSDVTDSMCFSRREKRGYYLLKGIFKNIMIRNYKISAFSSEGRSEAPDLGQPPPMFSDWYNIIEITIYLDKEFMP